MTTTVQRQLNVARYKAAQREAAMRRAAAKAAPSTTPRATPNWNPSAYKPRSNINAEVRMSQLSGYWGSRHKTSVDISKGFMPPAYGPPRPKPSSPAPSPLSDWTPERPSNVPSRPDYNKSGPQTIDGQWTYLGDEQLAKQGIKELIKRFGPRLAMRLNPWLSLADLALFGIDQFQLHVGKVGPELKELYYPDGSTGSCTRGGNINHVHRHAAGDNWSLLCNLNGQARWTDDSKGNNIVFGNYYYTGFGDNYRKHYLRVIHYPLDFKIPNGSFGIRTRTPPTYRPSSSFTSLPYSVLPFRQSHPTPYTGNHYSNGPPPKPPLIKTDHKWRPPPPRTKERKAKGGPAAVRLAMEAANATTEFMDMLNALWDAMPPEVQATAPKNGRCTGPKCVNPNAPYVLAHDKFLHIYRNMNKLDLPLAIRNLIVNHYTDAVLGRVFGGADDAMKRAGGTGWGRALG